MRMASVEQVELGKHHGNVSERSHAQVGKTIKILRRNVSGQNKWKKHEESLTLHSDQALASKVPLQSVGGSAQKKVRTRNLQCSIKRFGKHHRGPDSRTKCVCPCVERRIRSLERPEYKTLLRHWQLRHIDLGKLRVVTNIRCVADQLKGDKSCEHCDGWSRDSKIW